MKSLPTLLLVWLLSMSSISCQPFIFDPDKLSAEIEAAFEKSGSVGASVIVTSSHKVIYQKYLGYADIDQGKPVTAKSLFSVGSISKTFSALAILKLVEAGKLNLDDDLLDLVPELPLQNKWEDETPVKLFHILEHTAGFDELHPKDMSFPVEDDDFSLSEGVIISRNSFVSRWKPGSRFAYSNANYLLVGYIVEKYSGSSYNDFLQTEILDELGMKNTTLGKLRMDESLLAKSYLTREKALPFKHIFARSAGSVYSSAEDMSKFLQVLLLRGVPDHKAFLSENSFAVFEKHHSLAAFRGTSNGYRLGLSPSFHKESYWLGHGGSFNNYRATFHYNRKLDIGFFVVSNGPNPGDCMLDISENLFEAFVPAEKESPSPPVPAQTKLETFEGFYVFGSPRVQLLYPFTELFTEGLQINLKEDGLYVSGIGKPEKRLYDLGEGHFTTSASGKGFQFVFPQDQPGILYTGYGSFYSKSSKGGIMLLAGALFFCFFFIFSSLVVFFFQLFGTGKSYQHSRKPIFFLTGGAAVFLLGLCTFLLMGSIQNLHEPHFFSMSFFISSLIFPLLTLIGVYYLIQESQNISGLHKFYLLTLSFSLLFYSVYLYYWDFVGFRMWAY